MSVDHPEGSYGQTPIDEHEHGELIPSVISRAQLNEYELLNIKAAWQWAMHISVLGRADLLTDHFSRQLHRRMFSMVWRWAGRYRTTEKTIGWEPYRIPEGVRNVFDDAQIWLAAGTYPIWEIAVRLHYRLVLIHPWTNGNGRHARLMADVLIASRGEKKLTWGGAGAELARAGEIRQRYIMALRMADNGEIRPLLDFCHR